MRQANRIVPILKTDGLLFHIAQLSDSIFDGPKGIFVEADQLKENPILRTTIYNNIVFRFVVVDPIFGTSPDSRARTMLALTRQVLPEKEGNGRVVPIDLYAEWVTNIEETRLSFESAIEIGSETSQVRSIVHQLMSNGFECSCDFINILRRRFLQYWLVYPQDIVFHWYGIDYYSMDRKEWYSVLADEDFSAALIKKDWNDVSSERWPPDIMIKGIGSNDISEIQSAQPEAPYSFPEHMISASLIELSKNRIRSAILHAIIALESSAKRGLSELMTRRLEKIAQTAVLEAISQEIGVLTLSRVVYSYLIGEVDTTSIDWAKIGDLYNTRNTIVHRGQRRLPDFETTKDQVLQVFEYVRTVEEILRESKCCDSE